MARLVLVSPALGVPADRKDAETKLTERLDREGIRAIAPDVLPKAFPETLWECAALARWLGMDSNL